jgi:hypothetical protein
MAEFPLLDERQVQGLVRFFQSLLLPAHGADPTAPMPPPAVLVTVYAPAAAPTATVAWLGDIQVCATLPDGQRMPLSCPDLLWSLMTQPAIIRGVEPVTPYLAFVLYVHDLLWAWDFTPLGVAHADALTTTLLRWGPTPRRERRSGVFWALPAGERRQVLHETVSDYLLEAGRLRIPMRGILHAGWHDFGTGKIRKPSQILRYFNAALRRRRQTDTPASALPPAAQARYSAQATPPHPDDIEDYIQHLTAALPPQEQWAVRHWLRAVDRDLDFHTYCVQEGVPYAAARRAARRGLDRLAASR